MQATAFRPTNALHSTWFLRAFGFALLAAYSYAAFFPSGVNWGFHHLAFFPVPLRLAILVLMGALLLPRNYSSLFTAAQSFIEGLGRSKARMLLALLVVAGLFWFARERLFLLGDGALVVRTLPNIASRSEVVVAYRNEPFAGWLVWQLYQVLTTLSFQEATERAFQLMSIGFGIGAVVMTFGLARSLSSTRESAFAIALLVLAAATTQLFFGYVEHYAATVFALLVYFETVVAYLQGRGRLADACVAFGLTVAFHLGTLCFLPTLAYLIIIEAEQRKWSSLALSLAAFLTTVAVLLWVSGYSWPTLYTTVFEGKSHMLAFAPTENVWQAYTLVSFWHLVDLANLLVLVSPFAVVGLIVLLLSSKQAGMLKDRVWVFLLLSAACGIAFVAVVNSDLGMSRDWDLFSPFVLPLVLCTAYGYSRGGRAAFASTGPLPMMILFSVLHTASWIGLNATEGPALARFETLQDDRLWSRGALGSAYEELAILHRRRLEYDRAIAYFRRYLQLHPASGRVWFSLARVYGPLGRKEEEADALRRAVENGWEYEEAYIDLTKTYLELGRPDEAMSTARKALELFPNSAPVLNNAGVVLAHRGERPEVLLTYFLKALAVDADHADARLNAGLAYYQMSDFDNARLHWERYLMLQPHGPQAESIRLHLRSIDARGQ